MNESIHSEMKRNGGYEAPIRWGMRVDQKRTNSGLVPYGFQSM